MKNWNAEERSSEGRKSEAQKKMKKYRYE